MWVVRRIALEWAQIEVTGYGLWICSQRLLETLPGFAQRPAFAQQRTEIVQRLCMLRINGDGIPIGLFCSFQIIEAFQHRSEVVQRQRVIGIEFDGLAVTGRGLLRFAVVRQGESEVVMTRCILRGEVACARRMGDGFRSVAQAPTDSLEAYDLYLHGMRAVYNMNLRDLERSIEMFERALELDPAFTLAHGADDSSDRDTAALAAGTRAARLANVTDGHRTLAHDPSDRTVRDAIAVTDEHRFPASESEPILRQ